MRPLRCNELCLSYFTAWHFEPRSSCVSPTCVFAGTMIQVDRLLQVVLPEANIRPTATSSAGEDPRMRPPVSASAHDAGLDKAAELARLTVGAGQVLSQARNTKTKEEFWRDAEKSASATGEHTLNSDEHQAETRNTQAHVHEVDSRVDVFEANIATLTEELRGKRSGAHRRWRGNR
ncbi:unnamed protein product [Ectocarpus sp. 12 AP-2014]